MEDETVPGQELARRLLEWFAAHRRPLPWRVHRDPYRVWVSEVMLQQTRAETVSRRFVQFLEMFPTVQSLAAADEAQVLKAWEGLGYYSRARHLHAAAREIVTRYGGRFPDNPDELAQLPGIGRYTAAAVASIAFNRPCPAVDGNVARVMARLLAISGDVTEPAVRRRIERHVEAMIPPGKAGLFTEALMELGALVCTPRNPGCSRCPWQADCEAFRRGQAAQLPNRPARPRPRPVCGAVAVVCRGESVLVARRPQRGLLGGLWEFPWTETAPEEDGGRALVQHLRDRFGVEVREGRLMMTLSHTFTHLKWHLRVYEYDWFAGGEASEKVEGGTEAVWAAPRDLAALAFGRAHRRIASAWLKRTASGLPADVQDEAPEGTRGRPGDWPPKGGGGAGRPPFRQDVLS
ncbi:MAG: A/G-specific adenine glycosylase [Firmicutes bacterium]|nr:A/G-specific adenine glycosylase [Bacillota bacterium]